jgi:hypothetical protein
MTLERIEGARRVQGPVVSRHTVVIEEVVSTVQATLAATRLLVTDLFHALGSPEVRQLLPDGALLRVTYFSDRQ